jgi:hypothetical protein
LENILRNAVETRKKYLISRLIQLGAYDKDDSSLFQQNLSDLEEEYKSLIGDENTDKLT